MLGYHYKCSRSCKHEKLTGCSNVAFVDMVTLTDPTFYGYACNLHNLPRSMMGNCTQVSTLLPNHRAMMVGCTQVPPPPLLRYHRVVTESCTQVPLSYPRKQDQVL